MHLTASVPRLRNHPEKGNNPSSRELSIFVNGHCPGEQAPAGHNRELGTMKRTWRQLNVSGLRAVIGNCTWQQTNCSGATLTWSSSGSIRWHFRTR